MRRLVILLIAAAAFSPLGASADDPERDCGEFACVSADTHITIACARGSSPATVPCSATVTWEAEHTSELGAGTMSVERVVVLCPGGYETPCGLIDNEETRCTHLDLGVDRCGEAGMTPLGFAVEVPASGCIYPLVYSVIVASDVEGALGEPVNSPFAQTYDLAVAHTPVCAA